MPDFLDLLPPFLLYLLVPDVHLNFGIAFYNVYLEVKSLYMTIVPKKSNKRINTFNAI